VFEWLLQSNQSKSHPARVCFKKKKKKKKKLVKHTPYNRFVFFFFFLYAFLFPHPASMIGLTFLPSGVPVVTAARNISPVAKWHTLYFSLINGACVPLPAPGGPVEIRQHQRSTFHSSTQEKKRD
jgi:hypothetical protein